MLSRLAVAERSSTTYSTKLGWVYQKVALAPPRSTYQHGNYWEMA